jgi:hypothetical protein
MRRVTQRSNAAAPLLRKLLQLTLLRPRSLGNFFENCPLPAGEAPLDHPLMLPYARGQKLKLLMTLIYLC